MIRHAFIVGHVGNYPEFYKRAFNALKPGGSMQIVEIEFQLYCDDGTLEPDSALLKWSALMYEAFAKMGAVVPTAEKYKEWLQDAGYENVQLEIIKRPSNDWPKDPKWKEIGRVSKATSNATAWLLLIKACAVLLLELSRRHGGLHRSPPNTRFGLEA